MGKKIVLEQDLTRPDEELDVLGLNGDEVKEAAWKLYLTFDRPTMTFDVFARAFQYLFERHISSILNNPDEYYRDVFRQVEEESSAIEKRDAAKWVRNQGGDWGAVKGAEWKERIKVALPDGRTASGYDVAVAVEKLTGHKHVWQYWEGDDYVMCTRCDETRPIPEPTTQPA
jgi:hypothetical protein